MAENDILSRLTEEISIKLNKPPNKGLTISLIKAFLDDNSIDSFLSYCYAIGLPKDDESSLAHRLYKEISNNIFTLEKLANSNSKSSSSVKLKNQTKGVRLNLSFEDNDELQELTISDEKQKDRNKPQTKNTGMSILEGQGSTEKRKTVPKFKKIKKQDALRFKESSMSHNTSEKLVPNSENEVNWDHGHDKPEKHKKLTLSQLARLEESTIGHKLVEDEHYIDKFLGDVEDTDNDRDWYMADEGGIELDMPSDSDPAATKAHRGTLGANRRGKRSLHHTGGSYDALTGEYRDFDHDNDSLREAIDLNIKSHNYIPPFLADYKSFLEFTTKRNLVANGRVAGSVVNPIKNPNSELAKMAKKGSYALKEIRSKKEKEKKAKERSNLAGTKFSKVMGAKEIDQNEVEEGVRNIKLSFSEEKLDRMQIRQQRMSLPAFSVKQDLMRVINENQVVIVIGETGSGKTTQLTQFLYEEGYGASIKTKGNRKLIGCTQPRRVAAMSVAKRVSEEVGCHLGEEVGYAIRFEDRTDTKSTVIKYMTDGVLLREVLVDPNLDNYSCIIMDEAHERSLNTDVLLGIFKGLLRRRKDLKLIVTSATMNADRFMEYFGQAPQFTIPGRTFPVDIMYSQSSCADYVEAAVKLVLTIHLQNSAKSKKNDGDILVFMTGQDDIDVTCDLIQEKLDLLDNPPPLDIFPIYSSMPSDLQKRIFKEKDEYRRKVVVATNIAETSLTIDGIRYVIDSGLAKLKVYNPSLGMDTLQVVPISLANAQQRSGRAGRTGPGQAFRLYTEKAAEEDMYVQPIPEIQRTNLDNIALLLKSMGIRDILKFPFIDKPPVELLSSSLYELWCIGALDNFGELTQLGKRMCRFPMEPNLSKLIILSCESQFHCSKEIIVIVSMLSVPSVFMRPRERMQEADNARSKFVYADSDHLTLLNVFNQWAAQLKKPGMTSKKLNTWCAKNFLHNKSLLRAMDILKQIYYIMEKSKMPSLSAKSDENIKECLCAAFYHQLAKLLKSNVGNNNSAEYMSLRNTFLKMYLHPISGLEGSGEIANSYVIYNELILTNKEYMSCVTSVDPIWLLKYGGIFYEVSDNALYEIENTWGIRLISPEEIQGQLQKDEIKYKSAIKQNQSGKQKRLDFGNERPNKLKRRAF